MGLIEVPCPHCQHQLPFKSGALPIGVEFACRVCRGVAQFGHVAFSNNFTIGSALAAMWVPGPGDFYSWGAPGMTTWPCFVGLLQPWDSSRRLHRLDGKRIRHMRLALAANAPDLTGRMFAVEGFFGVVVSSAQQRYVIEFEDKGDPYGVKDKDDDK